MAREVHPDLESSAYGLLVRLGECGGQRATDLAAYIGVGKATCHASCAPWRNSGRRRAAAAATPRTPGRCAGAP
ncbi:hypothetical protein SVIOM342S_05110 [Streptomyces violaceorubidus]